MHPGALDDFDKSTCLRGSSSCTHTRALSLFHARFPFYTRILSFSSTRSDNETGDSCFVRSRPAKLPIVYRYVPLCGRYIVTSCGRLCYARVTLVSCARSSSEKTLLARARLAAFFFTRAHACCASQWASLPLCQCILYASRVWFVVCRGMGKRGFYELHGIFRECDHSAWCDGGGFPSL